MQEKMENTPMMKLIIKMSLPAVISMLIGALYNIVDSIFVAQLGPYATTAISLVFPMQMLIIAVGVGTGVGINSLASRRLGEQNIRSASEVASTGISLGILSSIAFAIIGLLFTPLFYSMFTNDPLVLKSASDYSFIVTVFSFGIIMQIITEKALQATGNMIFPMIVGLLGAVINITLDPILIFGYLGFPAMGIIGAGVATVIGQVVSMFLSLYLIVKKQNVLKIKYLGLKIKKKTVQDIYKVGFPSIILQSVISVLVMALNKMLDIYEPAAISILGIYFKLQSFIFMPVFGITQGAMPVFGYNFGARNKKRINEALKSSIILASVIMVIGTLLFSLFPAQLIGFFHPDERMLEIGVVAFRIISIGFIFAATGILMSVLFQASGFGTLSLILSILRQLVVVLPLAYLFIRFFGINYFWLSFPIADIFSVILGLIFYNTIYKKKTADFSDHYSVSEPLN